VTTRIFIHLHRRVGTLFACLAAAVAIAIPAAQANPGPLDPWAYRLLHDSASIQLITENSAGQNGTAAAYVRRTSDTPSQVVETAGFDWRDAGIGALAGLGSALFAGAAWTFVLRRRRTATA